MIYSKEGVVKAEGTIDEIVADMAVMLCAIERNSEWSAEDVLEIVNDMTKEFKKSVRMKEYLHGGDGMDKNPCMAAIERRIRSYMKGRKAR